MECHNMVVMNENSWHTDGVQCRYPVAIIIIIIKQLPPSRVHSHLQRRQIPGRRFIQSLGYACRDVGGFTNQIPWVSCIFHCARSKWRAWNKSMTQMDKEKHKRLM